MKKIIIVEDDEKLRKNLKELLDASGYEAIVLEDFRDSLKTILESDANLILLDINIPYINGEALIKEIRKESNVPIIMVTSRDSETDEALSISFGADDYITIGAVLKRSENTSSIVTYKDLKINMQKGTITKGDVELILTKNEMIIFNYLLNHQNKIVTRDELMTDLWSNNEYINDNALTVNVSRLRSKLKEVGYDDIIETRKKVGYILS